MRLLPIAIAAAAGIAVRAAAQNTMDWPTGRIEPYTLDSGPRSNEAPGAETVFAGVVTDPGAAWIRVYFGDAARLAPGSFIRVTSVLDDEAQELDAAGLARWGHTSAYFNGDTVVLELVAAPGTQGNRLAVDQVAVPKPQPEGAPGQCGICDDDDRVASSETWASRLLPAGCTASIFTASSCMVTAGHCVDGFEGSMVVQFNVPNSNGDCSLNNPPVADQFPIVADDSVNGGVGNDWGVIVPGTNNLGELPYERYGELRPIAAGPGSVGQVCDIWGYGVDTTCATSQTQQHDSGPITAVNANYYEWEIDIRGGNSGSSLILDDEIIGIITHCDSGGCPAFDNIASRIDLPAFVAARDLLCAETLTFTYPGGLPGLLDPAGETVQVVVSADSGTPQPGTGMQHVSVNAAGFAASAMAENAPNDYDAALPALACGDVVEFYFSAETTGGETVADPLTAPADAYVAVGGQSTASVFADDFQSDSGWTVTSTGGPIDGDWQRATPLPLLICDRGNPGVDADGSGMCYVTDAFNAPDCNTDVDNGSTILTSPVMDASDPGSVISYWRWFSTIAGSNPYQDVFEVEVSDDDGSSWVNLETVGPGGLEPNGGWYRKSFSVGAVVANTAQFRIRFVASDTDPQSVVEAGVDGVELVAAVCVTACPWDCDGSNDGIVGVDDFLAVLAQWGQAGTACDTGAGAPAVGIDEFLETLSHWGPCP